MNFDEMVDKVYSIFPNAYIEECDGEIIIKTGKQIKDNNIIECEDIDGYEE